MQTFLPSPSFQQSARYLDPVRLRNQRREVLSILAAISGEKLGWYNHPATRMWRGYQTALVQYGLAICAEIMERGYVDNSRFIIMAYRFGPYVEPPWLGDSRLHSSHRSNLLRKDRRYYSMFGWDEPTDLDYWWPV